MIEKEEEEEKKIGLREALKRDGSYSYSKVSKILAKMEDEKAEEIGLIRTFTQEMGISDSSKLRMLRYGWKNDKCRKNIRFWYSIRR